MGIYDRAVPKGVSGSWVVGNVVAACGLFFSSTTLLKYQSFMSLAQAVVVRQGYEGFPGANPPWKRINMTEIRSGGPCHPTAGRPATDERIIQTQRSTE